jgi:hypothetical protein
MKRSRLAAVSVLAAAGLAVGLFTMQAVTAGPAGGKGQKQGKKPAAAPAENATAVEPKLSTAVPPKGQVVLRVDFRSKGKGGTKEATVWDGQMSLSQGRVLAVRSWMGDPRDIIEGTRWTVTTRRSIPWNAEQRAKGHEAMPLQDSALLIELVEAPPDAELKFETRQGNFDFRLADVPLGSSKAFLNGLAQVSRIASATTILSAPTEDDYPAAAIAPDGKLYVAYVAFTHGKDFRKRVALEEEPKDLSNLAEPTGGDQVLLLRLDGDRWAGPMDVTPPGQDVFRSAMAIDKSGGVWVFWIAKRDGAWDLFTRRLTGETWSPELRLTSTPEPDVFAAATTDSTGRVWVVWQAFRGLASNIMAARLGQTSTLVEGIRGPASNIMAARQDGDRFGAPMAVAEGPAHKWSPAIAAAADGRVSVVWDTYQSGNYDVYCRTWSAEKWGETVAVATSQEAEMRPSAVYDPAGRLWIAYETAPEMWGKDWGALAKVGVPLYKGRSVAVRVLVEGRLMQPADDAAGAFSPAAKGNKDARGGGGGGPQLVLPRLAVDAKGRVWLAARSPRLGTRTNVGTVWFEHLAWYEGDRWAGDVPCLGTDNTLDNTPALVPDRSGEMILVSAADGRMATAAHLPQWFVKEIQQAGEKMKSPPLASPWPDPVNNELTMAVVGPLPGAAPAAPKLGPVTLPAAGPSPAAVKEAAAVARARAARTTVGAKTLRLARGEFHRHTEWSSDGAGDGMLMDTWRYGLDTASEDWVGNGDHDNGGGREYSWWTIQQATDVFHVPGAFSPMYTYERSCNYPDGHRNVVWAQRGVRTLPRLQGGAGKAMDDLAPDAQRPHSPDTLLLYRCLAQFDGVCASHTSGTNMGTDWRDNNAKVEPVVEIYQGCRQNYEMPGAPRSNTAENSIGGWRPLGFVSLALKKGYRLGFQSSSDHVSTHISYCSAWVEDFTNAGILAALKARHVFGATDNIIADVRCGEHFMGDEFTLAVKPVFTVRLTGTAPFAKVHVIKDGNYVHTVEPKKQEVEFQWTDFDPKPGQTSYYYVRGDQADGELVWASPMWITYKP